LEYWFLGKTKLSDGKVFDQLKQALDAIERKGKNNTHDSFIAETAWLNNLTLVTDDCKLRKVFSQYGGQTCTLKEFLVRTS